MTYTVCVVCSNCGVMQSLQIEKGIKIVDTDCPNCSIKSLQLNRLPIIEYKPSASSFYVLAPNDSVNYYNDTGEGK
jgi:hypothetical protein